MAIWNIKERNELVRSNEFIDVAPVCLWGGGATPSTINVIDQVNPVSTGNATDFGDFIAARQYMGGMGNKIKGIYGGGDGASNVIQNTANFASGGNSSDFGNLTNSRLGLTAVGNDTRIIFAGDFRQTDFRSDFEKNGILDFKSILSYMNMFDVIEFGIDDIVRSALVKDYIITKYELGYA